MLTTFRKASLSIYWIIRLRGWQVLVVGRLLVNGIRKSYEYGNCFGRSRFAHHPTA
jgi:hypothetical protein